MPWKRTTLAFLLLTIGIFLVSCGTTAPGDGGENGGGGGGGTDGVSQMGFVSSNDDAAANETGFGGGFVDFGADLPTDFLNDPFLNETLGCEVFVSSSTDFPEYPGPIESPPGGLTPTLIDAGAPLTVTSASTSFSATLTEVATGSYATTTAVSGSLPDDAVLNVPGSAGGFPEFTDAPFPNVAGFAVTVDPTNDFAAITVDSQYSWTAASDAAVVTLEAASYSFEGATLTYVGFSCVVDDAAESFELPADTKAELTAEGFESGILVPLTATRTGYHVIADGNAALILSADSQAEDPAP